MAPLAADARRQSSRHSTASARTSSSPTSMPLAGALAAKRCSLPWATSAPTGRRRPVRSSSSRPPARGSTGNSPPCTHRQACPPATTATSRAGSSSSTRYPCSQAGPHPPSFRFVGRRPTTARPPARFLSRTSATARCACLSGDDDRAADGPQFVRALAEAVTGEPYSVILVAPHEAVLDPPPNLHVRPWVAQLELLRGSRRSSRTVAHPSSRRCPSAVRSSWRQRASTTASSRRARGGRRGVSCPLRPRERGGAASGAASRLDRPPAIENAERLGKALRAAAALPRPRTRSRNSSRAHQLVAPARTT